MNVQAYLKRINYDGPLDPTPETLRRLQVAHLLAVPFENLSIHSGEPIILNDEALFQKIVERGRGGFCYELNGLFATLLRSLGFEVAMLSAQVADNQGFSPDFDHMTLMVRAGERWLADVGFGDSFIEPLLFEPGREDVQRGSSYRIVSDEERFVLEKRAAGDPWEPQYRFALTPYQYSDYLPRCEYQETSPESHFTQNRICSLLTTNGRISVSDTRFIVSENGARRERAVNGEKDYAKLLRQHFGIVM